MTTFRANGNYIDGEVTINDPNTSVAVVQDELAKTRAKAEEVLFMLVGAEGDGGLLGDMMAGLAAAPSVSITPQIIDTSVTIETSGQSAPTFNESSLREFATEVIPVPTTGTLPTIDSDFSEVAEPEDLALTLSWAESTLPAELFEALKAKIIADMAGGTGLSPAVEVAIYERARTRQQVDRLAEYDRINNAAADMQFAYPSGVLVSALAGFSAGANRMNAFIEETIIVSQGELAQKNVQSAMTQAMSLEGLLRATRSEESQRALDKVKSFAEIAIQDFSARIQKFIGVWEGRKVKVQAQSEALRGALDVFKGNIELFTAQNNAQDTQINAVTAYNKGLVDVFTGKSQGFSEAERAVSSRNDSRVKLLAEQIKNADLDLRGQIAEAEAIIQAYTAEQSIRERIVGGVSNIASQVSASLLSAVHTSLGANYSASESASKGYTVHVGVSENHEVPHDPAG